MPLTVSGKTLAAGEDWPVFPEKPAASALRLTMSVGKVSGIGRQPLIQERYVRQGIRGLTLPARLGDSELGRRRLQIELLAAVGQRFSHSLLLQRDLFL